MLAKPMIGSCALTLLSVGSLAAGSDVADAVMKAYKADVSRLLEQKQT